MSQTSPQTRGRPPAVTRSGPLGTGTGSTNPAKQAPSSLTATASRRSVRFIPEDGESEPQPARGHVSSVELVSRRSGSAGAPYETRLMSPRPNEATRRSSTLSPSLSVSPSMSTPQWRSFVEETSTSTTATERVEDTTSPALPCLRVLSRMSSASKTEKTEREDEKTVVHAESGLCPAASGRVCRARSVTGEASTLERSMQCQRQLSLAEVRANKETYCEMTEADVTDLFRPKDDTGDLGPKQLESFEWRSGDIGNEQASSAPCPEVSVAVVRVGDTCAKQGSDRQERGVAASVTEGKAQASISRLNTRAESTSQSDMKGQGGRRKSTPESPRTLKAVLRVCVHEFIRHPILDTGGKRVSFTRLRGRLCLTYCASVATFFVFIMELIFDHTTFHGRCISPILYPSYRLPLQDRIPYPVLFGYGACKYNLGQSRLYQLQSSSTTPAPTGDKWPADNVDVRYAPEFKKMNAWVISAMGGLDANKMRNYGEYFRLFTAMFMHASWLHLATNWMFLLGLLWLIEPVWGFLRTTLTFFVSGLTASLCASVLNPCTISVGASGALYGLMGALFPLSIEFWDYLEYPVWIIGLAFSHIVVSQTIDFFVLTDVDNWAHTTGLLAGMTFGFATVTSLHAWRWEGVRERLASSTAFSWIFSLENLERLRDANRIRVERYRRRRRSGKVYWPKVVWKWKGYETEWIVRVVCSALLIACWSSLILYLTVPSLYPRETFGPLSVPRKGPCHCCRLQVPSSAPADAKLPVLANEDVFWCFLGSLPRHAQCA